MDRGGHHVLASTELGRVAVSEDAIAQIVRYSAAESYGVVALIGQGFWSRLWGGNKGVEVVKGDDGLAIELRVVVERGLKLAEVATAVRARVLYELERMVGLPVVSLEVHIDKVRGR
ncbi:MAG: Asp23/Gls24 family envelope stress response protein [Actinomycetota bacterium]|nr:Asp23/Gls24 family envelope stress response protein [Actinomycetota bacterium]